MPSDSKMKFDIKGNYATLLSILNTIKDSLPQDNIMIIEDLIERCEHGYFLGFLIEKSLDDFLEKYPNTKNQGIRDKDYLVPKLNKFVRGRESRVITATKEAFGLTPEIVEKLNRMFVYNKVEVEK